MSSKSSKKNCESFSETCYRKGKQLFRMTPDCLGMTAVENTGCYGLPQLKFEIKQYRSSNIEDGVKS